MFWDCHMHCNFSGDSETPAIDMINAAKAKGLRGITFTDHLDIDYPPQFGFFDLDLENYYPKQHALALQESTDDFTILTGLEMGIQSHVADQCYEAAKQYDYDFIIGSTHVVDHLDPYYDVFWETDDVSKLLTRYYQVILENITVYTDFDALGHLDYIFRYKDEIKNTDTYLPYRDIVDAILEKIIKMDKALEINTGGYRKGIDNPNPSASIIKRYHELGGKLITLGADAHNTADIASDFEKLPSLLKECGFTEYAVYKNRKPTLYPLG